MPQKRIHLAKLCLFLMALCIVSLFTTNAYTQFLRTETSETTKYSHGVFVFDFSDDQMPLLPRNGNNFYWDWDDDGFAEHTGWLKPTSGFLFWDIDGDGKLSSRNELHIARSENGLAILAQLDETENNIIDRHDETYSKLYIWQDLNSNTRPDDGEVKSLEELGIFRINTPESANKDTESAEVDEEKIELDDVVEDQKKSAAEEAAEEDKIKDKAGHKTYASVQYSNANGKSGYASFVRFDNRNEGARFVRSDPRKMTWKNLPNLAPSGKISSLHDIMRHDEYLFALVRKAILVPPTDVIAYYDNALDILLRWTQTTPDDAFKRGPNIDGRIVLAVERMTGQLIRGENDNPFLKEEEVVDIREKFWGYHQETTCNIYAWNIGKDFFPIIGGMLSESNIRQGLLGMRILAQQHEPVDAKAKKIFWTQFMRCLDLMNHQILRAKKSGQRAAFILGSVKPVDNIAFNPKVMDRTLALVFSKMKIPHSPEELRKAPIPTDYNEKLFKAYTIEAE